MEKPRRSIDVALAAWSDPIVDPWANRGIDAKECPEAGSSSG
jgi:hypothetical protein